MQIWKEESKSNTRSPSKMMLCNRICINKEICIHPLYIYLSKHDSLFCFGFVENVGLSAATVLWQPRASIVIEKEKQKKYINNITNGCTVFLFLFLFSSFSLKQKTEMADSVRMIGNGCRRLRLEQPRRGGHCSTGKAHRGHAMNAHNER